MKQAKVTRSPEQEKGRLFDDKSIKQPSHLFRDFPLEGTPYRFKDLIDFMAGISHAQVGYESKVAKGRFAKKTGQAYLGRFENITGTWNNSFPAWGNRRALTQSLRDMQLGDHDYAMISSGNHATCIRKTPNNTFVIYDSNDPTQAQSVSRLSSVAKKIVSNFERVGCVSPLGEVGITIDTVSVNKGVKDCGKSVSHYQSLHLAKPTESLAGECHEILMKSDSLEDKASTLYQLYLLKKEQGLTPTLQQFIKSLPQAQQEAVKHLIHYFREEAFADSVGIKTKIVYSDTKLNEDTKIFLRQINEMMAQFHNGHLSQADFARTVVNHINNKLNSSSTLDLQLGPLMGIVMKLKMDMETFLEGTVSGSDLIDSKSRIDLNKRDGSGYSLMNFIFKTCPSLSVLQAAFEHPNKQGQFQYHPEDEIDSVTLSLLLAKTDSATVEYLATQIDLWAALTYRYPVTAYEFQLMSTLPNQDQAEKEKIYFTKTGHYCFLDDKGGWQQGSLKESPLNLDNLSKKIKDKSFQMTVLNHLCENGALESKTLFHQLLDSGNTEVIHYLIKAFKNLDHNKTLPTMGQKTKSSDKSMYEIAFNYNDENLAQTLLEQGVPLTPESAMQIIKRSDPSSLIKAYQKELDKEEGHGEMASNKPGLVSWAKPKLKPRKEESESTRYSYAQFQREHPEAFEKHAGWNNVLEKILASGNKAHLDLLLNAAVSNKNTRLAVRIMGILQEAQPESTEKLKELRLKLLDVVVLKGETATVKRLIAQDPSLVNRSSSAGSAVGAKSLLCVACEQQHTEMVSFLIKENADVNAGIPSPLYYAAKAGDFDLVGVLIDKGAKPDLKLQGSIQTALLSIMEAPISLDDKKKLCLVIYRDVNPAEIDLALVHSAILEAAKLPKTTGNPPV